MPNGNEAAAQMMAGQVMGGQGAGPAVDPAVIEKGRGLIFELTDLLTSDPNIVLALETELLGFGATMKQFLGGGGQQAQGPPGMGAGPPPGASPMGGGGPPMPGGMPPPGGGPPPGAQGPQGF